MGWMCLGAGEPDGDGSVSDPTFSCSQLISLTCLMTGSSCSGAPLIDKIDALHAPGRCKWCAAQCKQGRMGPSNDSLGISERSRNHLAACQSRVDQNMHRSPAYTIARPDPRPGRVSQGRNAEDAKHLLAELTWSTIIIPPYIITQHEVDELLDNNN